MPPCGKVSPVNTVTARAVQIRAHHNIDVYTDIIKENHRFTDLCQHPPHPKTNTPHIKTTRENQTTTKLSGWLVLYEPRQKIQHFDVDIFWQ